MSVYSGQMVKIEEGLYFDVGHCIFLHWKNYNVSKNEGLLIQM